MTDSAPRLFYTHPHGQLWVGDSIAWLKSLEAQSVDLLFADPPYNIKKAEWDTFESQQEYVAWSLRWIEQAAQVLKPTGEALEIRNKRIGQILAKLGHIQLGAEEAPEFEDWCLRAIKMCFAGPLGNIELHPNKNATQRRDVVATNQSERGVWRRILDVGLPRFDGHPGRCAG